MLILEDCFLKKNKSTLQDFISRYEILRVKIPLTLFVGLCFFLSFFLHLPLFLLTTWLNMIWFRKVNLFMTILLGDRFFQYQSEGQCQLRPTGTRDGNYEEHRFTRSWRLNGAYVVGWQMLWVNHWDVYHQPPEYFSVPTE